MRARRASWWLGDRHGIRRSAARVEMPNFAHRPVKLTLAIACALALVLTALPINHAAAASAADPSDFDGDGYGDRRSALRGRSARSQAARSTCCTGRPRG